jgi:dienelactone hydrolase
MDAAVEWLTARADVDPARVGMLGVSHGAEVALRTAARRNDVHAVVAEGAMGGPADARDAGASLPVLAQLGALFGLSILLTGETAAADAELVERIAPRPLLLISAGRTTEANANRHFQRRAGASAEHWNLADAAHAAALRTEPAEYERRVIGFLDRALR